MARSRFTNDRVAKTLDQSAQPLFVVDERRRIVFWSQACAAATGVPAAELLGRSCVYQAPDASAERGAALAAALCPPPESFAGERRSALRVVRLSGGGVLSRWVDYLPLSDGEGGVAAIIACLALTEASETDSGDPLAVRVGGETSEGLGPHEAASEELHLELARFRATAAGRFVPEHFVGRHPAIVRARAEAALAARGREAVLIVGPPGVGKERLARTIHYCSHGSRSGAPLAPLVPLACSAMGADLLLSTLAALVGKREAAHDAASPTAAPAAAGSLLLGEVDQTPLEAQRPLADLLASGRLAQRVLATAARPLDSLAAAGAFDQRLACALTTLVIEAPPLAERRADLPLLIQAFVEQANAAGERQLAGFAPEAVDLLAAHDWPGNLDELRDVVFDAHRRAEPPAIKAGDVAQRLRIAQEAAAHAPRRGAEPIVLEKFLADMERDLIARALRQAKGNKSRAAKLLGLTRPRLYRRMVQLGLEPPNPPESPVFEPI